MTRTDLLNAIASFQAGNSAIISLAIAIEAEYQYIRKHLPQAGS